MPTIYNTHEINLFDGEKLIAVGYFDIGTRSAAGISSFYDPSYKKYSLGKYLIYLKMEYCQKMGFEYFYPGYFVPGYKAFDYKLSKRFGRPNTELSCLKAVHAVSDCNNSVKIVEVHFTRYVPLALFLNYPEFPDSCL